MIEQLPKAFLSRMEDMLQDEYTAFIKSYENPRHFGLRVNTLKISVEEFLKINPFHLTPVPWTENGFYYEEADHPAKHPYYAAGLYYLQEPSAMAPAALLPVTPGDYVLDLCAAPGGKATELGAKLKKEGMLVPMISAIPVRKPCSEILNCAASPTRLSPMKYPHHWLKPCRNSLIKSWSTRPVPGRECSEKNLRLQKHGMRTDPTSLQSCSGNVSLPPFPC